jgi:hypothetical protein
MLNSQKHDSLIQRTLALIKLEGHYTKIKKIKKNTGFLDGFKPSRNWKKPSGKRSRRFFLDGFKPFRRIGR